MYKISDNPSITELLEVLENLYEIINGSEEGIAVVDDNGKIRYANRALSQFIGTDSEQMIGHDFLDFLPMADTKIFQEWQEDASENPGQKYRTITIKRKDRGHCVEVRYRRPSKGDNKTLFFFRDITTRVKVEEQLRERNAFYNSLIENSVDGIVAADMKNNIILFNKSSQLMLGYTEGEALNEIHTTDLYPKGVAREIMRKMRSEEHGGRGRCLKHQTRGLTKDGEEFPLSISGSIIYDLSLIHI